MIILWLNFKVSTQEAHPSRAGMEVNAVKLRKLREHRALFLRELSALSGVNYNSIWRIEVGRTGAKPRTVRRLAEALGVEPCELLREG
jgi:transcriptional regulator with XRE-family HTH domain